MIQGNRLTLTFLKLNFIQLRPPSWAVPCVWDNARAEAAWSGSVSFSLNIHFENMFPRYLRVLTENIQDHYEYAYEKCPRCNNFGSCYSQEGSFICPVFRHTLWLRLVHVIRDRNLLNGQAHHGSRQWNCLRSQVAIKLDRSQSVFYFVLHKTQLSRILHNFYAESEWNNRFLCSSDGLDLLSTPLEMVQMAPQSGIGRLLEGSPRYLVGRPTT